MNRNLKPRGKIPASQTGSSGSQDIPINCKKSLQNFKSSLQKDIANGNLTHTKEVNFLCCPIYNYQSS